MIFQRIVSFAEFGLFALLAKELFRRWRQSPESNGNLLLRAAFFAASLFAVSNLLSIISNFAWPTGAGTPVLWSRITTAIALTTAYWWVAFATDFFSSRRLVRSVALVGTVILATIGFLVAPGIAVRGGHLIFTHPKNPIDYLTYFHALIYWLLAIYGGLALMFTISAVKAQITRARTRMAFLAGGFWALTAAIALIPVLLLQHIGPVTLAAYTNVLRALGLISAPLIYWGLTDRGE